MKRFSVIALALLLALMGVAAVQAQDTATPEPTVEPTVEPTAEPTAGSSEEATPEPLPVWVRVINWSTDGASVDVLVDEAVSFGNVAGATNTEYVTFPAGEHAFAVVAAGTAFDADAGSIQLVEWEEGQRVTIAIVGSAADGTLRAIASDDDYSPIRNGSARIYAYHAVPGLANVDVFVGEDMVVTELGFPGTFTDLSGVSNDGAFAVDVPAGTYDISIRLTGDSAVTGLDNAGTTTADSEGEDGEDGEDADDASTEDETVMSGLVDLPQFTLEAGTIYTIAIVGSADAPTTFVSAMPGVVAPLPSALDVALSSANYSILAAAVTAADPAIADALRGSDALTIFAPTNAAFDAFLNDMAMTPEDLFADTDLLNAVLRYHVVAGMNDAAAIVSMNGQTLSTLQGETITISLGEDGGVVLNNVANVVSADIATSNGVVHVIDAVLVPPSLSQPQQ